VFFFNPDRKPLDHKENKLWFHNYTTKEDGRVEGNGANDGQIRTMAQGSKEPVRSMMIVEAKTGCKYRTMIGVLLSCSHGVACRTCASKTTSRKCRACALTQAMTGRHRVSRGGLNVPISATSIVQARCTLLWCMLNLLCLGKLTNVPCPPLPCLAMPCAVLWPAAWLLQPSSHAVTW
jgi:hypothetical protein